MSAGHVFISHGSENSQEAREVTAFLESHGLKTWIAPRDVRPGMDYSEQLQAAIEQCLAFVVLVSETANTSPYVRAETEMAFSNNKPIFPVRRSEIMPAAGLAFFLKIRHWTDAYGANAEASMARLAQELRSLAGLPNEAAPQPAPSKPATAMAPPPLEPPVKVGLPRSTLIAMIAGGLLVLAVAIALALGQNRADPAPPPSPNPSPQPGPEPAPEPAPGAAIDRGLLIGRWASGGDCANALEFADDGRVLTADGTAAGTWLLNGDTLAVTTADGQQHSGRINSVDQSALYTTDNQGSVEVSQRC